MPFFRQFIAFLMIAVCFNTAIGVPLHAMEHLKAGTNQGRGQASDIPGSGTVVSGAATRANVARATAATATRFAAASSASRVATQAVAEASVYAGFDVVAQSGVVAPGEAQSEGGADTSAELCAVCAAYGQPIADFVIWPTAPPHVPTSALIIAFNAPPPGAAVQWPYSARDPPRA